MYKTLSIKFQGISPLVMHNGRLANPIDPITKAMKRVTSKRSKTDDDYALLSKLEFIGSLYLARSSEVSVDGYCVSIKPDSEICIPSENVEALLIEAARKNRKGAQARAGILIDQDVVIAGAPTLKKALDDPANYFFTKRVKVQRAAVMRTRAIFRKWSCDVSIGFLPDLFNDQEVREIAALAGRIIGLGDYRPRYGRFDVL